MRSTSAAQQSERARASAHAHCSSLSPVRFFAQLQGSHTHRDEVVLEPRVKAVLERIRLVLLSGRQAGELAKIVHARDNFLEFVVHQLCRAVVLVLLHVELVVDVDLDKARDEIAQ